MDPAPWVTPLDFIWDLARCFAKTSHKQYSGLLGELFEPVCQFSLSVVITLSPMNLLRAGKAKKKYNFVCVISILFFFFRLSESISSLLFSAFNQAF